MSSFTDLCCGVQTVAAELNVLLRNEKSVPCNVDALAGSLQVTLPIEHFNWLKCTRIDDTSSVPLITVSVCLSRLSSPFFFDYCCKVVCFSFYRAMHFSAKRGIAIACRLSVCLSVCNVGEL